MPQKPRSEVFDPETVGIYHCWNRLVRRCYLFGYNNGGKAQALACFGDEGDWGWADGDFDGSTGGFNEVGGSDFTTLASNFGVSNGQGHINTTEFLIGFTGRMYDVETGLQNNLHRWYDAKVGRWISQDPIGFAAGDANLYRYVGNSPTKWVDPSGLILTPPNIPGDWFDPNVPDSAPGEGWEFKHGESGEGRWCGPEGDSLHNDLEHAPGKGPHINWKDPHGNSWDYYPDSSEWKPDTSKPNNPNKPQPTFPSPPNESPDLTPYLGPVDPYPFGEPINPRFGPGNPYPVPFGRTDYSDDPLFRYGGAIVVISAGTVLSVVVVAGDIVTIPTGEGLTAIPIMISAGTTATRLIASP